MSAAPVHVRSVRELVIDRLSHEQLTRLAQMCRAILNALPSDDRFTVLRSTDTANDDGNAHP